jgi:hypothetical protein
MPLGCSLSYRRHIENHVATLKVTVVLSLALSPVRCRLLHCGCGTVLVLVVCSRFLTELALDGIGTQK